MNIRPIWSATALAALACCQAHAQSSVTLYGNIDVGFDHVNKGAGNLTGLTHYSAQPSASLTRVSPSLSSQSMFGLKASEDLGGGYTGRIALEGSLSGDTGALGQDGRIFGRQSYVALGTPYGEVRAGRQGAPMLTSFYLSTTELIGSTDMMASGLVVNNLQIYQDNMLSYVFRSPSWIAQVSYSPNAGVASSINALRAPAATATSGQIIAGATSGAESPDRRGETTEAMLTYQAEGLKLTSTYHYNKFGVSLGRYLGGTTIVPIMNLESYSAILVGGRYTIPGWGTTVAGNFLTGHYKESGTQDPKINTFSLGFRQPVGGGFTVGAQYAQSKFSNFTRGKDTALMLVGDYDLSKRTTLYTRIGYVQDDRGNPTSTPLAPGEVFAGGPGVLLIPLGAAELPVFSGAGINVDARTSIVSVGIRHSF